MQVLSPAELGDAAAAVGRPGTLAVQTRIEGVLGSATRHLTTFAVLRMAATTHSMPSMSTWALRSNEQLALCAVFAGCEACGGTTAASHAALAGSPGLHMG